MDEFEREALRLAALGDMEARRAVLALAADALRRGVELSPELRAWLADALLPLLAAVEATGGADLDLPAALAPMGFERTPRHRPRRTDDEVRARGLRRLAAVHLLTLRAGSRSQAVGLVAEAEGCDSLSVWRDLGGGAEWTGTVRQAMRYARGVIRRARALGLLSRSRRTS